MQNGSKTNGFVTASKNPSGAKQSIPLTMKSLDEFNKVNGNPSGMTLDIDSLSEDGQQAVLDLFKILIKTYKSAQEPLASSNQNAMVDMISGKGSANASHALKKGENIQI